MIKAPQLDEARRRPGFGEGSLMRPRRRRRGARQLNADEARLTNLRLAPERIDATLLTTEGRLRHVQIKPGGKLERFGTDGSEGFDKTPTIRFAALQARRAAAARAPRGEGARRAGLERAVRGAAGHRRRGPLGRLLQARPYVIGDARGRFERPYP